MLGYGLLSDLGQNQSLVGLKSCKPHVTESLHRSRWSQNFYVDKASRVEKINLNLQKLWWNPNFTNLLCWFGPLRWYHQPYKILQQIENSLEWVELCDIKRQQWIWRRMYHCYCPCKWERVYKPYWKRDKINPER